VSTLVTNLLGPDTSLSFLGAAVSRVMPVPSTMGKLKVAFGVLSYAGTLTLTVVADPERCTDLPLLVEAFQENWTLWRPATGVPFRCGPDCGAVRVSLMPLAPARGTKVPPGR
jgi:hypothetical protein